MNLFQKLMQNLEFRFILIGGINTILGYLASIGIYSIFQNTLHISVIAIINAILAISISFVGQRYFVFRSNAPWFPEYLKMYLVNALSMGVNIIFIWFAIDILHLAFWLAQAIITILITIYMYFALKYFTFKNKHPTA